MNNLLFVEKLVQKQMLLYLEEVGPWVRFTDTVHEGLAHLTEVISKTNQFIKGSPTSHNYSTQYQNQYQTKSNSLAWSLLYI